jgi:large subunit ribosomal protein L4
MSSEGKELRSLEVDDSVFGIKPNQAVLHQAFVTQRNNQRAGTASTKTRGMVQGSTRKTRMQKYTGRARHGGIRAPIFVGGGIAFGPQPRDFGIAINKKMRRLAIRSALSGKVADGELIVIDELSFKAPKTREVLRILRNVGIERSALIVTGQPDRTVLASARNIQKTKVLPAAYLNVADMLNHRHLLMTEEAIKVAEGLWGRKRAAGRPVGDARPSGRRSSKAEAAPEVAAEAAPTVEAPDGPTRADARPPGRRRAKVEAPAEATATEASAAVKKPSARRATATPAAEKPARSGAGAAKTSAKRAETPKPARRAKADASADAPKSRPRTRKPKSPE